MFQKRQNGFLFFTIIVPDLEDNFNKFFRFSVLGEISYLPSREIVKKGCRKFLLKDTDAVTRKGVHVRCPLLLFPSIVLGRNSGKEVARKLDQ